MASKAILRYNGKRIVIKDKEKKFAREFLSAANDIKMGKLEGEISLESSLEVIKIMDEIRKQIGVKFPCD